MQNLREDGQKYSLNNLRALMKESEAYGSLSDSEKMKIQKYFDNGDKFQLMRIYYALLSEKQSIEHARKNLSKKLEAIESLNFKEVENLRKIFDK